MYLSSDSKLVRIAVFYDGGYFDQVSRYYKFQHQRHARLNLQGVHRLVSSLVAEKEKVDESYCHVVESHYFRGRFPAKMAEEAGKLLPDRQFDEVLMLSGIVQHNLPMAHDDNGGMKEKGIDVWLSLEAFDLAVHKRFDVLALVAGDGDYVPLVRKLAGIGTRVLLLGWDFEYEWHTPNGVSRHQTCRTSESLIQEVTYPIMMTAVIDDRARCQEPLIRGLFVA